MTAQYYPLLFAVLFLLAYLGFTFLWKILVNNLFVKEELQQAEKLKQFSSAVSKTLHLQAIMNETIQVIKDTMDVETIYICMQEMPGDLTGGCTATSLSAICLLRWRRKILSSGG